MNDITIRAGQLNVLVPAGVTGAALLMANRLWTPQRLLNAIKIA